MQALLIAEKPDLMRKIEACYRAHRSEIPYSITFTAQRGHLVTLKKPDELDEDLKEWSWDTLPIHPEEHGGWQYKIIEEPRSGNFMTAKERYDEIKNELKSGKYDFVIHAGDPDQEGELLVRCVLDHMKNTLPVKRFWTNDLTERHILYALKNLRDDDNDPMLKNLLAAAYGRQHSDYRVGMNASRGATLSMGTRVAVGRVKSVMLSLVCKREDEIAHFVPKTSYGVQARYTEGFTGILFNDRGVVKDEETGEEEKDGVIWFDTEKEAKDLIRGLSRKMEVISYKGKRQETRAPKLFKLATAQIEAGKMGYSAADTLRILQKLYEKKYMTYPRTGCEYLGGEENFRDMIESAGAVPGLKTFADSITDKDIARVQGTKIWVNAAALQEEGHSALVPTNTAPDWGELDDEEKDIYAMVCRQFLAAFLPPLVQDKAELVAKNGSHLFKSTGTTLISEGWTKIFKKEFRDKMLPKHEEGDILDAEGFEVTEKTSVCPKRYTTADLIAVCEAPHKFLEDTSLKKLGKRLKIGTPATRANIIEELILKDRYLKKVREGKREVVVPTDIGAAIIENIGNCDICKVDLTGEWEEKLEKVRSGKLPLEELEESMKGYVEQILDDFRHRRMKQIKVESKYKELGPCPVCGKKLMRGPTQFYCSGYKEGCSAGGKRERYGFTLTDDDFLDMVKGKVIIKEAKSGEIRWQQEIKCDPKTLRIIYVSQEKDPGYTCPVCGRKIVELPYAYRCEGYREKTCGVYISKAFPGKTIDPERFRELFTKGESGVIDGIVSNKTKKTYSAKMVADKNEKKIVLKYVDKEEETKFACPVCGRKILSRGFRFICEGIKDGSCNFSMFNTEYKEKMTEARVQKFINAVKDGSVGGGGQAYITDGDVPTKWTCPTCGRKIMRNGMRFTCSGGCGFAFGRTMAGHILTDHEIDDIIQSGKTALIQDFVSKKGKPFPARAVYSREENGLAFAFEDESSVSKYKCPLCGKHMREDRVKFTCSCGLTVWKKQGQIPLTDEELDQLFNKGRTGYRRMVATNKSSGGKSQGSDTFVARVVIDPERKGTKYEYQPRSDNNRPKRRYGY